VHYFDRRPDGLIELLEAQRDRWRGWALVPTNDLALAALAQYREPLSRSFRVTVPEYEVTRRVLDRATTYRLAREVGVDVPRSYGAASRETIARLDLVFPLVIKPLQRASLSVVRDRMELTAAVDRIERSGMAAEVLDLVPGPEDQVYNYIVYLDRWGRPAAEFGVRQLRKAPRFLGVERAAAAVELPQLRERTVALLQRLGWRGIASVEYKLDPRDGRYRLMQVKGRCPLVNALPASCGVNYPLLAWREHALGETVSAAPNGGHRVWTHLHADLLYTAMEEGDWNRKWLDFIRGYAGAWVDAVWSTKDPVPFFAQWAGTARRVARGVRDGQLRDRVRHRFQAMPALAGSTPTEVG
jgi:predicted ATP-grasp superfamily ATP-dependent carboligase